MQSDLREWDPASLGQAPDVVVTSSTLQWVPGHLDLLDAWVGALADGGWLALQVPGNFDAPSHRLMRETAEHHERAGELTPPSTCRRWGSPPPTCATSRGWAARGRVGDDVPPRPRPRGRGREPRAELGHGNGLRPVLDILTDEEERAAFVEPYAEQLAEAYPRTPVGVLFPFRRVFAVARKAAPAGSAVTPRWRAVGFGPAVVGGGSGGRFSACRW